MGDFTIIITDERGSQLNGVLIQSGRYDTFPCPAWPNQGQCVPSPGGEWEGTSDSSGKIVTEIGVRCGVEYTCNLYADGYDLFPFSSGRLDAATGGSFTQTVQLVASSVGGGAPQNSGGNTKAGNLSNQVAASTEGVTGPSATKAADALSQYWWVLLLVGFIAVGVIIAIGYSHKEEGE